MANFMKKGPKVPKVPKPVAKAPVKTENIESEVTEEEIPKSAEKKLEVISEVIEEQKVVAAQEKVEEVEEEIVDQEEDDKIEDKVEEEIIEDANKEEEVKAPIKSKAKAKSSKKKAQPKQDKVEDPNVVMITDIEDIESIIAPQLLPEPEGWKEEKERINELVNKTMITEELDPTSVRSLLQDMSTAYREIAIKAEEANTFYDNLQDQIKHIREKNYIGSNAEERKLNSANSVSNYINENGECVDLMSYSYFARARASFYNSALKNVETNRQMLITFSSVFKIELSKAY